MKSTVKVLDGGMGTALSDMGLDLSGSLWSARVLLENPNAIKTVHEDHARAGADILTSSSYQASLQGFEKAGYTRDDYLRALEKSTELVCEVAEVVGKNEGRQILVAASIGPYGATLADGSEYRGDYDVSKEFLVHFHAERLDHILQYEFDYLAFETVPSVIELEAINELLSNDFQSSHAWVSCSANSSTTISDGTPFRDAIKVLTAHNIVARGINCTHPDFISPLLDTAEGPFVVYPNAGTWDAINRQWLEANNSNFTKEILQGWIDNDVKIIGGCCGLGVEYIKEISAILGLQQ